MNPDNDFSHLGGIIPAVGDQFVPIAGHELRHLESVTGGRLPADYRQFAETYGAASFSEYIDFDLLTPLPSHISRSGEGHFSLLYGSEQLAKPEWMAHTLAWNMDVYYPQLPKSLIPIGGDGGGNQICLGVRDDDFGRVYYWDQEHEVDEDSLDRDKTVAGSPSLFPNIYLVAESFQDFLGRLRVSKR